MAQTETMAGQAESVKTTKAAKATKALARPADEQTSELEKRAAVLDARIAEKTEELKQLTTKRRKLDQELREAKERQLREFIKSAKLDAFSPDAWRCAEAEIRKTLESVGAKAAQSA